MAETNDMLREMQQKLDGFGTALKTYMDQTNTKLNLILEHLMRQSTVSEIQQSDGTLNSNASTLNSGHSLSSASEDSLLRNADHDTNCMVYAFQKNIENIIDCLPFDVIQDRLVERGLVTIKESDHVSQLSEDRIKVRTVVNNIMDKKRSIMLEFLELIAEWDERLKDSINDTYLSATALETDRPKKCTACLLKEKTNINDISDSLYAQEVISRKLYKRIVNDQSKVVDMRLLWEYIFDELSRLPRGVETAVLERALSDDEGIDAHEDIVQHIRRDFARNRRSSRCRCSRDNRNDRSANSTLSVSTTQRLSMSDVNDNLSDESDSDARRTAVYSPLQREIFDKCLHVSKNPRSRIPLLLIQEGHELENTVMANTLQTTETSRSAFTPINTQHSFDEDIDDNSNEDTSYRTTAGYDANTDANDFTDRTSEDSHSPLIQKRDRQRLHSPQEVYENEAFISDPLQMRHSKSKEKNSEEGTGDMSSTRALFGDSIDQILDDSDSDTIISGSAIGNVTGENKSFDDTILDTDTSISEEGQI